MAAPYTPAIRKVVDHYGGPTELSRRLGGSPVYQEIQRWTQRGWGAPKQFLKLEPLLGAIGLTLRDLYADIEQTRPASQEAGRSSERASKRKVPTIVATARTKSKRTARSAHSSSER